MGASERDVPIPLEKGFITGTWTVPSHVRGVVVFAHGTGSGRRSARNRYVAHRLQGVGFATLLLDLLTEQEEGTETLGGYLRFDVDLLKRRLSSALAWVARSECARVPVGWFGASTGAAAALRLAAEEPDSVAGVVARGGRPDLAGECLPRVRAPTLLVVGADDDIVVTLNERAMSALACIKDLVVIPGAGHLFEEEGTLESVAEHARTWFDRFLVEPAGIFAPQ